jgi:hypothetical protein
MLKSRAVPMCVTA